MIRRGFTLLEMAIVLVIIGLVAGAVLVAQELMEAAQMRKIMKTVENYSAALYTFQEKYECLPGDCDRARDFFPAAYTNGNGDGQISFTNYEHTGVWQHMSLAGIIGGSYGGWAIATYTVDPGVSHPAAAFDSTAAYVIGNFSVNYDLLGYTYFYGDPSGNNMALARRGLNTRPAGPFWTPRQMYIFDRKFDDGNVQTGGIRGLRLNPNTALPGHCHDLSYTDLQCAVIFIKEY